MRITGKKIFYTPGIITLIILPILFFIYADRYNSIKHYHVIKLFLWDPDLPAKYPALFGKIESPKRNFQEIVLTGDAKTDKIKIEFAQVRIREILSQNDSLNGVHFFFEATSTYGSFIKSIDILQIEKAKIYRVSNNNIWFYNIPPDTTFKNSKFESISM